MGPYCIEKYPGTPIFSRAPRVIPRGQKGGFLLSRRHGLGAPSAPGLLFPFLWLWAHPRQPPPPKDRFVQVLVRDNNVDQALKALKKKMQREGIFREMKLRGHYEKPSEKRAREKAEAVRRARKLARKKLQREGLLPMKPKPAFGAAR